MKRIIALTTGEVLAGGILVRVLKDMHFPFPARHLFSDQKAFLNSSRTASASQRCSCR
jgi:hypothetical protein